MSRMPLIVLSILLAAFFVLPLTADDAGSVDRERSAFVVEPDLKLWGLELNLGYRGVRLVPGVDTVFWLIAGAANESMSYYRLPSGDIYRGGVPLADPTVDPKSRKWYYGWGAGISQGVLWNDETDSNLLELFLFYRARFDNHLEDTDPETDQLLFRSSVPDRDALLQNAFLTGFSYDGVVRDKTHKIQRGVYGELSAEWGPEALQQASAGETGYLRFNATVKGFLPLYVAAPDRDRNLFSLYAGSFLSADYFIGDSVPLNIRQSFGGLSPRTGLGGAVRGVDSGAFDSRFKAVCNLDLRATLPAIVHPDIVPGIVTYFDTGYYHEGNEVQSTANQSGFIYTTGAGVYIDLFEFATLALYAHYLLNGENADGKNLVLGELAFGLRF